MLLAKAPNVQSPALQWVAGPERAIQALAGAVRGAIEALLCCAAQRKLHVVFLHVHLWSRGAKEQMIGFSAPRKLQASIL